MKTLLVEDDAMTGMALVQALRDAGHAVDWVTGGHAAAESLAARSFDIVLLDLGLPERSGFDLIRIARANDASVPILVLTARDDVDSRIGVLDTGADDYMTKPYAVGELLARIRALLRRAGKAASTELGNGRWSLDLTTKRVSDGRTSHLLSRREFELLRALLVRPGAVLSRPALEERIYGSSGEVDSNVVEYIIHGLRKKLGPDVIKNVRGLGWVVESVP